MNAKTKGRRLRERRHVQAARIIYAQAQAAFPRYSHPFSLKQFTLPQLATCALLSFYFKMSYRDFEALRLMSRERRDVLELTAAPDYSTLNQMYHRFRAGRLDKMNEALLSTLDNGGWVQEDVITLDSTLFSPDPCRRLRSDPPRQAVQTPAERRVCRRCQQPDEAHGVGPSNDAPHLSTLKRRAGRYGKREKSGHPVWATPADSGFDSAAIDRRDIIPPIRRGGSLNVRRGLSWSRTRVWTACSVSVGRTKPSTTQIR